MPQQDIKWGNQNEALYFLKLVTNIHNSRGNMTMDIIQRLETLLNSLELGDKVIHRPTETLLILTELDCLNKVRMLHEVIIEIKTSIGSNPILMQINNHKAIIINAK